MKPKKQFAGPAGPVGSHLDKKKNVPHSRPAAVVRPNVQNPRNKHREGSVLPKTTLGGRSFALLRRGGKKMVTQLSEFVNLKTKNPFK